MIQPHYVSFQQAKLLKEKGFEDIHIDYGQNQMLNYSKPPEQWQVVEWLRLKGIIIELIVDGWKDDNNVSEEFLCYRIFIWQIGKPKPGHNGDIGALATPQQAYAVAFDHILNYLI